MYFHPTFENSESENIIACGDGITLRQWYAGLAMQGMFASGSIDMEIDEIRVIAKGTFKMADAMIAESEKPLPRKDSPIP